MWLIVFTALVVIALQYPYRDSDNTIVGPFEYIPLIGLCVAQILEPEMSENEREALERSAATLRNVNSRITSRLREK